MNSKEKFLETATELFSKFGFSGVSVRYISKALGMRESAMYKHFSSKADILKAIIQTAKEKLENFQKNIKVDENSVKNTVYNMQEGIFDLYVLDPFMNRFRKIMIISQYESDEASKRYQEMFIDKSLGYYEKIFGQVINEKNLKLNPRFMAYEFFATIFILLQQNDCQTDNAKIKEAKLLIQEHIKVFFDRYSFLEV